MICLASLAILASAIWAYSMKSELKAAFETDLAQLQALVVPPVSGAVWDFDVDLAEAALLGLQDFDGFVYAAVVADGDHFATFSENEWQPTWDGAIEAAIAGDVGQEYRIVVDDLVNGEQVIGSLVVAFDVSYISAIIWNTIIQVSVVCIILFFAAAAVLYALISSIARPINGVATHLTSLENEDTDIDVPEAARSDEIGVLGRGIIALRDSIIKERKDRAERLRVQQEQELVTATMGEALAELSKGILSIRLGEGFPASHSELREHFNAALTSLSRAVSTVDGRTKEMEADIEALRHAANHLAGRTEEQSAKLEHSSKSLSNLRNSMQSSRESTQGMLETSHRVETEVNDGDALAGRAAQAMDEINTLSREITQSATVVDDIAFQTNLLALNAGVEAARAGAAGSGFAVVAHEVRSLSIRAAEAAEEIKDLVRRSQASIETGVGLVGQTRGALNGIVSSVSGIIQQIDSIVDVSDKQTEFVADLHELVTELDDFTQQNAAMAEETSATTSALSDEFKQLAAAISSFETDEVESSAAA